jgi:transcriptional regulator with XRE-family HTH domain
MGRWQNPGENSGAHTVVGVLREATWLGAHVRERRHELELTQEELADRAEMSVVAITQLERGRTPSIGALKRILAVLGEDLLIGVRGAARPGDGSAA